MLYLLEPRLTSGLDRAAVWGVRTCVTMQQLPAALIPAIAGSNAAMTQLTGSSATSVEFTALWGAADGPVCHLLQVDGWTALFGCGWDDACSTEALDPIVSKLKQVKVDAVILCHADPHHLGALPYLVAKCGLSARVYSTLPVRRMGEMFMQDLYHQKQATSDFNVFSLEDVRRAFQEHPWTQLRYSQHLRIAEGKMAGVTLTPYNAGHMVGGAMWKLVLPDDSEFVYAVDWCHKKERHLNGATLSEFTGRPALMVAGAAGCLAPAVSSHKRDAELLEVVISTLRGDGCVLIPVDAAGRMLEVAMLLDEFWSQEKLPYPLVALSHTAPSVFDRAQQQLEWMSDHISAMFGAKRDNPMRMRCLQPLTGMDQLAHLPAGPKVVLASSPGLETGFSRQLLVEWASDPKNTICFVQRAKKGSLADRLQSHVAGPEPLVLDLEVTQRVPLQGAELEEYLRQATGQGVGAEMAEVAEVEDDDVAGVLQEHVDGQAGDEGDVGPGGAQDGARSAGALAAARSRSLGLGDDEMQGLAPEPEVLLEGFQPPQGSCHPMFPDEDEPMLEAWDAYGMVSGLPPLPGAPGSALGSMYSSGPDGVMMDVMLDPGQMPSAAAEGARPAEEEEPQQPEVPTKLVTSCVSLMLQAAVRYFDFSGRADGPILRKSLQDIAPRNLLLVQGTSAERADLAAHCRAALADLRTQVLQPGRREPVQLSLPRCITLFLSDQLNMNIGLQRMQRYALAQIETLVGPPDPHQPMMLQLMPVPDEPELEDVFITDSANGIQLSHVKKALADAGLESFFHSGRLVCGNVAISKGTDDKAHLVLEGALCDDFFKVREVIYSQFSVC